MPGVTSLPSKSMFTIFFGHFPRRSCIESAGTGFFVLKDCSGYGMILATLLQSALPFLTFGMDPGIWTLVFFLDED